MERGITKMVNNIAIGDIFVKKYVDYSRYFLAIKDSFGMYCECVDIQSGEKELVKILPSSKAFKITILS